MRVTEVRQANADGNDFNDKLGEFGDLGTLGRTQTEIFAADFARVGHRC